MKNCLVVTTLLALCLAIGSGNAFADSLTAKFKGGCSIANTTQACTIRVTATGTPSGCTIQYGATRTGSFKNVSNTVRSLSTGTATFKFKNKPGCYRAVSAKNGNDVADLKSKVICEE